MKPIELKLAALQSYREEQCIDFRALCETGLFGIFGPTGSGKSTILDAMTLALYGKVTRAINGTQGILNQAENQLAVAFTFELGGTGEQRLFRVERRFKRTGDITVSNTISRFVEIMAKEEIVVADKLIEVTRCVEQYIGLKMDDFTRAVVLPQGKFAEFLSLKGSERRQMLQRLFSLTQYGDELTTRISCHAKDANAKLMALTAEQQGLGDASEEAIQLAQQTLAEATARAYDAREAKLTAASKYEEIAELRGIQQEYERIVQRKEVLQAQAQERTSEETKLKQAREADKLISFAEEAEQLAAKREAAEQRLKMNEAQSRLATKQAQQDKCTAEEAKEIQEREEPGLLRRIEQLQEAVSYQQKRDFLRKEEGAWKERLEAAQQRYCALSAEIERLEQLIDRGASRQAELRATLVAHTKSAQEQEQFQLAVSQYEKISFMEDQCQQLEQCYRKHIKQEDTAQRLLYMKFEELVTVMETIQHKIAVGLHIRNNWRNIHDRLTVVGYQIEVGMEDERQQHQQAAMKQMAVQLAAKLIPAAPCPVCGSISHPEPAQAVEGLLLTGRKMGGERQKQEEQLKSLASRLALEIDHEAVRSKKQFAFWLDRLCDMSIRVSSLVREHGGMDNGEEDRLTRLVDDGLASQNEIHEWSAGLFSPDEEELRDDAVILVAAGMAEGHVSTYREGIQSVAEAAKCDQTAQEMELMALQRDTRIFFQNICKLEQQMEPLWKQATDTQWELQQLSSDYKSATAAAAKAKSTWEEASQLLVKQRGEWALQFAGFHWSLEHMLHLQQQWHAREANVIDCRERLEKIITYVEEMKDRLNQNMQLRQAAEMEQVNAQAEGKGIARIIADYEAHLQPWQNNCLLQLQAAASARLAELRVQVKQASEAAERSRAANEASRRRVALSKQAWVNLSEQATVSMQRLQEQLSKSSFQDVGEFRAASMPEHEYVRLEGKLIAYAEEVRDTASQLKRLEKRVGSTFISDEQWATYKMHKEAAEAAYEAAVAAKAKAERDAEQIISKHTRWMELEATRSRTGEYAGRLQQLQSVFRGNAFVEFIAEEQLVQVSRTASARLKQLTRQRYALEADSDGGFVIRDDSNGGVRRPVSTLSGGETFLTSLALALALSSQIQLRGKYPLEFFFLDEGFGTLDPELLDTVVTALEKLPTNRLSVGVISHVPGLRARLARKLAVLPAEQAGQGSRVVLEMNG